MNISIDWRKAQYEKKTEQFSHLLNELIFHTNLHIQHSVANAHFVKKVFSCTDKFLGFIVKVITEAISYSYTSKISKWKVKLWSSKKGH